MATFDVAAFLAPGFSIRIKPPRVATSTADDATVHVPWVVSLDHGDLSLHIEGGRPDLVRLRNALAAALDESGVAQ